MRALVHLSFSAKHIGDNSLPQKFHYRRTELRAIEPRTIVHEITVYLSQRPIVTVCALIVKANPAHSFIQKLQIRNFPRPTDRYEGHQHPHVRPSRNPHKLIAANQVRAESEKLSSVYHRLVLESALIAVHRQIQLGFCQDLW
jgi:hypothetical protein